MRLKPSRTLLTLQNFILFQRNLIRRLSLLGIDQICIDLCGDDKILDSVIIFSLLMALDLQHHFFLVWLPIDNAYRNCKYE